MKKYLKINQQFFYILIRSFDSFKYFDKCIDSVLAQSYKNYKILFVDDASKYNKNQTDFIKNKLEGHTVVFNKERKYSLYNAYHMINKYANEDGAVVFNLDGDDCLMDNDVLAYVNLVYQKTGCFLTYGECVHWNGKELSKPAHLIKQYTNIPYPKDVVKSNSYRNYPFLPLHPRTWKVWLFKKIKRTDFLRPDGSWLQFAEDQAMFYPMLEIAKGKYAVMSKPLYVYNIATKNSDNKQNLIRLLKDELIIRRKTMLKSD